MLNNQESAHDDFESETEADDFAEVERLGEILIRYMAERGLGFEGPGIDSPSAGRTAGLFAPETAACA
jgi:hypothetical protein